MSALIVACSNRDVVSVQVDSVQVDPGSATLAVGGTRQFTAQVRDERGEILPGRVVTWSSGNSDVLEVSSAGLAQGRAAGTTEVRATALGVTGTATVTVEGGASIELSIETLNLAAATGGNADPVEIQVTNEGGGVLSGLSASVSYTPGQPTGWLGLSLAETTAPTVLTVIPSTASLADGTYSATVSLSASGATNSPFELEVTLTVSEDTPILRLVPAAVGFAAVEAGSTPPGQSVSVQNIGGGSLSDLTRTITYQGAAGWLTATLAGTTAPTDLDLTVDQAGLEPGSYQASVSIASSVAGNSPRAVTVTLTVEARPQADLSVTKEGPAAAVIGDTVRFVLTVVNDGPRDAVDVTLSDTLPRGLDFVAASADGALDGSAVVWALGTVEAGATVMDTVTVLADSLGAHDNVARVTSPTEDPDPSNDRSEVSLNVQAELADMSLTKAGPIQASIGDTLEYVLTTVNGGPGDAEDVVVMDSLPEGVTILAVSGSGAVQGRVVTWTQEEFTPGQTRSDTVRVQVDESGGLTDVARVTSTTSDPLSLNNRAELTTSVDRLADLSVVKAGPTTVMVGDTLEYVLTVSNAGPDTAAGVALSDSLPAPLTFVSASAGGSLSGTEVIWTVGVLAPGASRRDTVRVVASTTGDAVDVASVISSTLDPDSADRVDSLTTVIRGSDLSVAKTGPASAEEGDTLVYVITVTNDGPDAAPGVGLTDSLPANVDFLVASSGGTHDAGVVTWGKGTIAAGATTTDSVRAIARAAGTAVDVARVSGGIADPTLDDRRDEVTTVVAGADISVEKTGPEAVSLLEPIEWSITVTNDGPGRARDLVLVDSLPPGVVLVSTSNGATVSGREITWTRPVLQAGADATVTVTVTAALPGAYTNVARVSSSTDDPDLDDLRDTHTTTVAGADVSIAKTGPASAAVGETIIYVLTTRNDGPDGAGSITVIDSLPAGVTLVGTSAGATVSGSEVTWTYASAPAGAEFVDSVRVVPNTSGSLVNVARVNPSSEDPDTDDQRDTLVTAVSGADLSVTKAAPASAELGDTIRYVIQVTNDGPGPSESVVLRDSLPAGVSFVSASEGGTLAGTAVTWNLGTMSSGTTIVDTVVAVTSATGTQTNIARVSGTTADPDEDDRRTTASTTVSAADLSLVKTGPTSASVGDTLIYVLTVSNAGPDAASSVSLVDSLPAATAFVSATGGGTLSGSAVTWTVGTLAAGAGSVDTLRVIATATGTLTNVARVGSPTADPDVGDRRSTLVTSVSGADLSITKGAQASVPVGDTIVYVLATMNAGPDAAQNVVVTDSLPPGVMFVSATGGGTQIGTRVSWTKGTLTAGTTVVDSVRVVATTTGPKSNIARVASTTADVDVDDRRTTALTSVTGADLSLVKAAPSSAGIGDTIPYVLTISNAGPDAATEIVLRDSLPAGVSVVSVTGGGTVTGSAVVWDKGTLSSGQTTVDTLRVVAASSGSVTNIARVTSPTADPDSADRRSTASTSVDGADLSVTKSAPASVEVGDTIRYALRVSNSGPDAAQSVTLVDSLPAGVTFVGAAGGGTLDGTAVSWSYGALEASGVIDDTVTVLASTTGLKTNIARVESPTGDPDLTDRRATASTTVVGADLTIEKTATGEVTVGETIEYVITVTNDGPDAAADVVVVDTLPAGVTFVSATDGGVESDGVVTWTRGTLTNAQQAVQTVTVTAGTAGTWVNVARASSSTADPDEGDLRDTAETIVNEAPPPSADLTIEKTATGEVTVGDLIEYVITVTNNGPDAAADVVVVDTLPAGVSFVSATDGGVESDGVVTWTRGTLTNGQQAVQTVTVTAGTAGTWVNIARASSSTADPDGEGPRATAETIVNEPASSADLVIAKTAPAEATVGETIEYGVTVTNDGPDAAADVVVVDTLPAGVSFVSATDNGVHADGVVTWPKGTLTDGQVTVDTVMVLADASGTPENVARASSSTADPDGEGPRDTASTTVNEPPPQEELDAPAPRRPEPDRSR